MPDHKISDPKNWLTVLLLFFLNEKRKKTEIKIHRNGNVILYVHGDGSLPTKASDWCILTAQIAKSPFLSDRYWTAGISS